MCLIRRKTKTIEDLIKKLDNNIQVSWSLIGKNSTAHDLAYKTFRRKIKPGRKITALEIWKLAKIASKFLAKKTAGGRLKIGLSPTNRRSAPASKQRLTRKKGFVKPKK